MSLGIVELFYDYFLAIFLSKSRSRSVRLIVMSVIFVVNLYFLICCIFSLYLTHQLISSSDLHIRLTELKLKLIHLSSLFVKPSARGKLAVTVSADLRRHSKESRI